MDNGKGCTTKVHRHQHFTEWFGLSRLAERKSATKSQTARETANTLARRQVQPRMRKKGTTMENVILNDGTVMTDAEFVKKRGGNTLTDFVATKADLVSLAHRLADELLTDELILLLQSSRSDKNRRDYTSFRLDRVMQFLPELDAEIREKLRVGYEENAKRKQAYENSEEMSNSSLDGEEVAAKELAKAAV
jgi:hypothetical protein